MCIEDKWAKPTFAIAIVFTLTGLAGTGAAAGAATIGGATSVTVETGASRALANQVRRGKSSARQGRYNETLLRMGLRDVRRLVRTDRECALHATGQVRDCLQREPCARLQRTLATISDGKGGTIVLSVAWVDMPTSAKGRHFWDLIDTKGSGGIVPLEVQVGVKFTGKHRITRRDGSLVVIAETTVGGGQPDPAMLDALAEVAAELHWSEG